MDHELRAEWARANRGGRAATRKKALATLASVAVTGTLLLVGYFFIFALFDTIRVIHLALPWFPALPAGWAVRNKLWPRGALAR